MKRIILFAAFSGVCFSGCTTTIVDVSSPEFVGKSRGVSPEKVRAHEEAGVTIGFAYAG